MPDSRWKHQNKRKNKTNHKNCLCAFALAMINNITLIKGFTMELARSLTRSLARLLTWLVHCSAVLYIYIYAGISKTFVLTKRWNFTWKWIETRLPFVAFLWSFDSQSVGRTDGRSVVMFFIFLHKIFLSYKDVFESVAVQQWKKGPARQ